QRGRGNAELFSRATRDGPCLQENNPILRRDVIGMDRNIVTGDLSFEDTHFSDILSNIALIFGEVRSDLEFGPPFFVSDSLEPDIACTGGRMHPWPDLSTVEVNDSVTHLKNWRFPWPRRGKVMRPPTKAALIA